MRALGVSRRLQRRQRAVPERHHAAPLAAAADDLRAAERASQERRCAAVEGQLQRERKRPSVRPPGLASDRQPGATGVPAEKPAKQRWTEPEAAAGARTWLHVPAASPFERPPPAAAQQEVPNLRQVLHWRHSLLHQRVRHRELLQHARQLDRRGRDQRQELREEQRLCLRHVCSVPDAGGSGGRQDREGPLQSPETVKRQ